MGHRIGNPLRLLAPVALVAFGVAFLIVLTSSDVEDEGGSRARPDAEQAERGAGGREGGAGSGGGGSGVPATDEREDELPADVYVVKTGDTLAGIAEKTGLTVERLQLLNPDLDPQALVSGQKIKLRE